MIVSHVTFNHLGSSVTTALRNPPPLAKKRGICRISKATEKCFQIYQGNLHSMYCFWILSFLPQWSRTEFCETKREFEVQVEKMKQVSR